MQLISAQPLIDKFREDLFDESEAGAYFMGYMILIAVGLTFSREPNHWDVAAGVASVVITVFGILHLKRQNGESFGKQFLAKYFCFGWVISMRMILMGIPAVVVLYASASIIGGTDAIAPMGALITIAFEIIFYWWVGLLFAQSNRKESEQDVTPNA